MGVEGRETAVTVKPPRFFSSFDTKTEGSQLDSLLFLSELDSHHARDVLRLQVGDCIEISERTTGILYRASVTSLTPAVTVKLSELLQDSLPPSTPIILLQALCKGTKNDDIADWATELGCHAIIFWPAQHSVVKLTTVEERAKRSARLQKISESASKQSRQPRPPHIEISPSLESAITAADALQTGIVSLRVMCSLSTQARPLNNAGQKPESIQVVVGPEGDFSRAEEEALFHQGFVPISLGARVLRSELAAVTAIVSIQRTFDL